MGSRSKPGRETKKPKKDRKVESISAIEVFTPEVEVIRKPRKEKDGSTDTT